MPEIASCFPESPGAVQLRKPVTGGEIHDTVYACIAVIHAFCPRIGDKSKATLLLGKDDKPVTTRKEAEAAAALLRPVLRARQNEKVALYVASARNLR